MLRPIGCHGPQGFARGDQAVAVVVQSLEFPQTRRVPSASKLAQRQLGVAIVVALEKPRRCAGR
jgi:hypothetical protein